MGGKKEGYLVRSYFRLMLNKLKVMGSHLYLYPFKDNSKKFPKGLPYAHHLKFSLKTISKYK
jgi:hypothetical protein